MILNLKNISLNSIIFLLFTFCIQETKAQNIEWNLAKDKNGIKVYTRKLPNANFKDYRVEAAFNTTADNFLSFLLDFENYKNWFANTEECYLIEKKSETELIQYFEAHAPWPVSNRECATKFDIKRLDNGNIRINLSLANEYLQTNNGVVRITNFSGFWEITKISENKISVVQQIASDPGGAIPAWLANAVVVDTPYESFNNLKKVF